MFNVVRIHNNCIELNRQVLFQAGGSTNEFLLEAYKVLDGNYTKFFKMDLLSKLGMISSTCLQKIQNHSTVNPYKKCILLQNSTASIHADTQYQKSIHDIPSPALFVYTLPNIVMGEIAIRYHYKGENTFFIVQEFDILQLVNYAKILATQNIAQEFLLGYIDGNDSTQQVYMLQTMSETLLSSTDSFFLSEQEIFLSTFNR